MQPNHVVCWQGHVHVTEALSRKAQGCCLPCVGKLPPLHDAHTPQQQQVVDLLLRQIDHFLQEKTRKYKTTLASFDEKPGVNLGCRGWGKGGFESHVLPSNPRVWHL